MANESGIFKAARQVRASRHVVSAKNARALAVQACGQWKRIGCVNHDNLLNFRASRYV
jgi:hypothetical protein